MSADSIGKEPLEPVIRHGAEEWLPLVILEPLALMEAAGNYGEMFECNVGRQSPLKLDRGLNRLWSKGGLMDSPPIR